VEEETGMTQLTVAFRNVVNMRLKTKAIFG
jgi:hypothetical protein